jgi:hypothetical protein
MLIRGSRKGSDSLLTWRRQAPKGVFRSVTDSHLPCSRYAGGGGEGMYSRPKAG